MMQDRTKQQMNFGVYLSPITHNHITHLIGFSDDPELIDTMGWHPFRCNESERFIKTVEILTLPDSGDGDPITFSIIAHKNDVPIGYVTLKGIHNDKSKAEIGIAIMDGRYRSGGHGTEALKLVADYAFNTMNLSTIALTVFHSNTRAIKAYEKVGFKTVDILKKSWTMPNGEKIDMLLMALNKKRFCLQTKRLEG
nr:GNAT family protein [uncultured Desulfobacter sp.]